MIARYTGGEVRRQTVVARLVVVTACAAAAVGWAEPPTRAEEWRRLREEKQLQLEPNEPNKVHRAFLWARDSKVLERLAIPGLGWAGFRPAFGGLPTGAGFGGGVRWDRLRTLGGAVDLHVEALASLASYQLYRVGFDLPRLADDKLSLGLFASYQSRPREDFFGLGPESREADKSSYLVDETGLDLELVARPHRWLTLGGGWSLRDVDAGPGEEPGEPSIDELFDDVTVPGIGIETELHRYHLFAELSTLDHRFYPRRGTWLKASYSLYDDRDLDRFDFDRVDLELRHFFNFNNGHRVVAFRARTSWDDAATGHEVPFYLQQTVGGASDLRGFEDFRFRDERQLVLNLEYRWQAWIGLDGAFFVDAGKVFRDSGDLNFEDLEAGYGIGFRFNNGQNTFLRFDVGNSREGPKIHFKFQRVFP